MNTTYKLFTSIVFILFFAQGCTDGFEELNENPNAPQNVDPQFLLSNVISVEANQNGYLQGFRLANYLAQFAASVEFERVDRYEMGSNSNYWDTMFRLLSDIKSMRELETSNEAYGAVGDILQSYIFSQMTDLWNDVPYSEAVQALDAEFTPAYDTQESIYTNTENGILVTLEQAVTVLENTNTTINGDVLFNGDLNKWVRFANSLRLRYLLRISKRLTDFSEIQALADSGELMQSNDDNAVLPYLSAAPNQYPMSLAALGLYQEHRMTQTVEAIVTLWDDPRVNVLYKPTQESLNSGTPEFKGLLNGQSRETIAAAGTNLNDISLFGTIFRDVPDGVDAQFMQYSEVQFALAEAVERGFITGDANVHYENAIAASFAYYEVALPADYFTRDAIALNGTDNLDKILTQKWFSLISNGHEAWFNVRRTGIPNLIPGPDNFNNDVYPVRYLYPESEQATNSANYAEAVSRIGGDNINSQGWWEQD